MIVITGARGFIGSSLVRKFNSLGFKNIALVDEFENEAKNSNLFQIKYKKLIERSTFLSWFEKNANDVSFVFHLGARADTTEQDKSVFDTLNLNYSKAVFEICTKAAIPLLYASSASTYGDGSLGYDDTIKAHKLHALNPYGESKLDFDKFVESQEKKPPFWVGLKFFNVYGPQESHKGRMASVVFHAYNQIKETGKMRLFASHKDSVANGEQKRDFVYVKDVVNICHFFFKTQEHSGIYNVGTGEARTFNDLSKAVFKALNKEVNIEYIPTPFDIRNAYQYFTEANMTKLRSIGYKKSFTSLEKGINDYVWHLEDRANT